MQKHASFWFFLAIALLALNLFGLNPLLTGKVSGPTAILIYNILRVGVLIGYPFCAVHFAKRNRFQAMSATMGLAAVDQIVFKFFIMKHEIAGHPENFVGLDTSNISLLYNVATGFLMVAPFMLLLGFVGVELNRFKQDWKKG